MDFRHASELLALCQDHHMKISQVMRKREIILGETEGNVCDSRMFRALEIMKQSALTPVTSPLKSMGGLIGGESKKLADHQAAGNSICGSLLGKAITYAMAVLETNACSCSNCRFCRYRTWTADRHAGRIWLYR